MADEIRDMPRRETDEVTRVINEVCDQNNITQADVSKATGLNSSYICRMFDGQYDPNFRVLQYIYKMTEDRRLIELMFGVEELLYLPLDKHDPTQSAIEIYIDANKSIMAVGEVVSRILNGGSDCSKLARSIRIAISRLHSLKQLVDELAQVNAASNKIDKVA